MADNIAHAVCLLVYVDSKDKEHCREVYKKIYTKLSELELMTEEQRKALNIPELNYLEDSCGGYSIRYMERDSCSKEFINNLSIPALYEDILLPWIAVGGIFWDEFYPDELDNEDMLNSYMKLIYMFAGEKVGLVYYKGEELEEDGDFASVNGERFIVDKNEIRPIYTESFYEEETSRHFEPTDESILDDEDLYQDAYLNWKIKRNEEVSAERFYWLGENIELFEKENICISYDFLSECAKTYAGYFKINDGILSDYSGFLSEVKIPESVRIVETNAFSKCNMKSLIIPSSVKVIDEYAFNCRYLETVIFMNNLVLIKDHAFSGTPLDDDSSRKIKRLTERSRLLDEATITALEKRLVIKDGELLFALDKSMMHIDIPDSVDKIGDYAFENFNLLKEIIFPDSITKIGRGAFSGCKLLSKISIPDSVEIEEGAFEDCDLLDDFTREKIERLTVPDKSYEDDDEEWDEEDLDEESED